MAHSLGNLVAWEALRIHKRDSGGKLINNIMSVEPALRWDAFEGENELVYGSSGDVPITYSTDELKQHSWRFWFNGAGNWAGDSANAFYHTFNANDYALDAMRLNDYVKRLGGHFGRTLTPGSYRRPSTLDDMPVLMESGSRFRDSLGLYDDSQLRLPAGTISLSLPGMVAPAANVDGTQTGWRDTAHSDFVDRGLPVVYPWYNRLFDAYPKNEE